MTNKRLLSKNLPLRWGLLLATVILLLGSFILYPRPAEAFQTTVTCQVRYTVASGDSLSRLAQRYGVTVLDIAQANSISNANLIRTGQTLCIPALNQNPTPVPPTCQTRYTVQRGDTLSRIGQRYSVSWLTIAQANNISNANLLRVGQQLCLPASSQTPADPDSKVPMIAIDSVTPGRSVTIRTANFPANQQFVVLMGKYGTRGINGTPVATINSGAGGSFGSTFQIPATLQREAQIAIRLESSSGYYSFNWFHNN